MKLNVFFKKKLSTSWKISLLLLVFYSTLVSCTYNSEPAEPAVCDVSVVTFSSTIKPILDRNCSACHYGVNPVGVLNFETFTDLMTVAKDGRLVGSINHRPGFVAMPLSLPKLPDCDIKKIEKWVNDGALNN